MQAWSFKSFNLLTARRKQRATPGKPQLLSVLTAGVITATLLLVHFSWTPTKGICSMATGDVPLTDREARIAAEFDKMASPLVALLHYATSPMTPQQSTSEISVAFDVLQSLAGHDSLMWDSFNLRGTTLFLEEDMNWTRFALQRFPILRAHTISYRTRLSEAEALISSYKKECWSSPSASARLKGNKQCKLALSNLPDEVYDRDWDVIMIDAPRGYFA
ncbi:hypothetical protein L6164_004955 [Bauhinia variegata]|uniref:Uncharacterized protein n=1 Tax=Bauhinia variegata TaxID=167791 RepID=A0ACB9PQD4_BAUVA|nr:hypothetical protein L6164_004955 [Bauhinia variegata]